MVISTVWPTAYSILKNHKDSKCDLLLPREEISIETGHVILGIR